VCLRVCVSLCVRVRESVYACMCVCVCLRERGRERARARARSCFVMYLFLRVIVLCGRRCVYLNGGRERHAHTQRSNGKDNRQINK